MPGVRTKWGEAMPIVKSDDEIAAHFVFNQIITRFRIPRELVTDHGSHFQKLFDGRVGIQVRV